MDRNLSRKEVMYLDLEKEVARLNKEKAILLKETNDVIVNLSGLKERQMITEKNMKDLIDKTKIEADEIIKKAKGVENEAIAKKSQVEIKITGLDDKQKELDNLIKSNQGLEKSLNSEKKIWEEKTAKVNRLLELIKKEIGG